MSPILIALHVLACLFLILVVLLQPGKGMDLSAFGGGASQTFFGTRGATSLFVKITVGTAALFLVTSFSLGLLSSGGTRTVLDRAAPTATEAPAPKDDAAPAEAPPAAPAASEQAGGETAPPEGEGRGGAPAEP